MKILTYTGKFRLFHPPSRALWSLAHKIVGFTAKSIACLGNFHSWLVVTGTMEFWMTVQKQLGRILPTDELIFFRGVGIPPTGTVCNSFDGYIRISYEVLILDVAIFWKDVKVPLSPIDLGIVWHGAWVMKLGSIKENLVQQLDGSLNLPKAYPISIYPTSQDILKSPELCTATMSSSATNPARCWPAGPWRQLTLQRYPQIWLN